MYIGELTDVNNFVMSAKLRVETKLEESHFGSLF